MRGNKKLKSQFLNSLKRGTGEAYLISKSNPNIDFSNQIIKGALNIFAYDGQCEGDRAQYIFDIISTSKQKNEIRKSCFKRSRNESDDTWNLTHLFALTKPNGFSSFFCRSLFIAFYSKEANELLRSIAVLIYKRGSLSSFH